jgi:hypothetical protein
MGLAEKINFLNTRDACALMNPSAVTQHRGNPQTGKGTGSKVERSRTMTTTVRKTAKGFIVAADGYSEAYRAYVQGNTTFKVFIPATVAPSEQESLIDFARQVVNSRDYDYRTDAERACRVMSVGKIQ